jgi:hypothetical protein
MRLLVETLVVRNMSAQPQPLHSIYIEHTQMGGQSSWFQALRSLTRLLSRYLMTLTTPLQDCKPVFVRATHATYAGCRLIRPVKLNQALIFAMLSASSAARYAFKNYEPHSHFISHPDGIVWHSYFMSFRSLEQHRSFCAKKYPYSNIAADVAAHRTSNNP